MNPGDETPRMLGDRYEVGELLGRGGMAEVHLCRDHRLNRLVAVKMLRGDLAADPTFQARFRREAHSSAALNHPSVVAVYDTGEDRYTDSSGKDARVPYIVMEHVEGKTVKDVLGEAAVGHAREDDEDPWGDRRGPGTTRTAASASTTTAEIGVGLGTARAVEITAGVLTALDYSHRQGIVHRDIKPANVMITPDEVVKVMDFGIARAIDDGSATMTQTSAVIGTAQYLSPEQARGESVDARTDVYSAGCLLYEVLTGQPPFTGDSPVSVAYQHVREVPEPPSVLDPSITPEMDRVVLHALAKDREDRYASAAEFRRDLLAAGGGYEVAAPTVAQSQAATRAMPATGTAALGVAGTAGAAAYDTPTGTQGDPLDRFDGRQTAARRYEEEPRRRGPVVLVVIASLLAAGLLGLVLWTLLRETSPPPVQMVAVPVVEGLTADEARDVVGAADLRFEEDRVPDDAVEEDVVIGSDPPAGEQVGVDSTVTVSVSTGPEFLVVPGVAGQTEPGARDTLRDAGFRVDGDVDREASADVPEGEVIRTSPSESTELPPDATVRLVVSSGRVVVEDVTGKTGVEATQILAAQGFNVLPPRSEPTGDAEPGVVVAQSPEGGEEADPGSDVTLTLAEAPAEPEPTDVPPDSSEGGDGPTTGPTPTPGSGGTPTPSPSGTSRPSPRPTQPPQT